MLSFIPSVRVYKEAMVGRVEWEHTKHSEQRDLLAIAPMRPFRWGPSFHLSASEEEFLVKRVLETHAPDGRYVDSELLLSVVEDIMRHATPPDVHVPHAHEAPTIDNNQKTAVGGIHKPFRHNIYKLSHEIMSKCFGDGDSHATTMMVFDLLGSYSWDGKLVLVLAAFAMSYGELFLITSFHPINLLATSIAMLTQLPSNMKDTEALRPRLTALNSLVKTMVDVTKCIIEFESLPMQYKSIDIEAIATMKTYIHVAAYWVIKGVVASASQIADLTAKDNEKGPGGGQLHETPKKHSSKQTSTAVRWELWSFTYKVKGLYSHLRKQLDACYQCIEEKLQLLLAHLFEEAHGDNQKVLRTLLSLKDALPLWDGCSQEQISIDVLREKTVLLLLSKINIPLGKLQLLVQQIYDHPVRVAEKSYEIVWIPFPNFISWTHAEAKALNQVANTVPWYFLCRPWLLSSAVVTFMKEALNFKDEPLLVVLDHQGRLKCSNAMDMALIWGGKAYPFSRSREAELWEETRWTLEFIMGDLDPLISMWIKEGRTICLYGSDSIEWIREFTRKMKEIIRAGIQLVLIYVGNSNQGDYRKEILSTITKENLSGYLPETKINLFWIRLNSMRSSKLHLGKDSQTDAVTKEITSLLSHDTTEKGWAVMGEGSSPDIIQLHGSKLMECLTIFQVWRENLKKVGFLNAIRNVLNPLQPLEHRLHSRIFHYVEGRSEGPITCEECRRPMEKCILYQCLQKKD